MKKKVLLMIFRSAFVYSVLIGFFSSVRNERKSEHSTLVVGYQQQNLPKLWKWKRSVYSIKSSSTSTLKLARRKQWIRPNLLLFVAKIDDNPDDLEEDHEPLSLEIVQRETRNYLQEQFSVLSDGKDRINFETLCSWEEIKHLFQEEVLSKKELKKIYLRYSSDLYDIINDSGIGFEQFVKINYDIDDLIEFSEELTSRQYQSEELLKINSTANRPLDHEFLQQFADTFVKKLSSDSERIVTDPEKLVDRVPGDLLNSDYEQMNLSHEEYDIIMEKIIASKNFPEPSLVSSNENLPLNDQPIQIRSSTDSFEEEYHDDYSDEANDRHITTIAPPLEDVKLDKRHGEDQHNDDQEEDMYTDGIEEDAGIVSRTKKSRKRNGKARKSETLSTENNAPGDKFNKELTTVEDEDEDEEENEYFSESQLSGMDIKDVNVWDHEINAADLFQKEFLQYLIDFYQQQIQKNRFSLLSFAKFSQWEDIQGLTEENHLDTKILKNLWIEATEYERIRFGFDKKLSASSNSTSSSFSTGRKGSRPKASSADPILSKESGNFITADESKLPGLSDSSAATNLLTEEHYRTIPKKNEKTLLLIHLDTFIRLNYRLEQVIEDVQEVYDQFIHQESNQPFLEAFSKLTAHHHVYENPNFNAKTDPIITYEEILSWDYVQRLLAEKILDVEEVESFYKRFPLQKQFIQLPPVNQTTASSTDRSNLPTELRNWPKMVKKSDLKEITGLNRDKFLFFCMKLKEKASNRASPALGLLASKPSFSSNDELSSQINSLETDSVLE